MMKIFNNLSGATSLSDSQQREDNPITNQLTTWLDHLPTEIIFMIFNYLSNNDIIYTFFYFNKRFNNLILQNQQYFNYFESPTTNFDIWKNIFSIIGPKIECLNLKDIDLSFSFDLFSNLKSLIISLPVNDITSTLYNKQFQNLHSLKLKENECLSKDFCEQYTWYNSAISETIFRIIFNDKTIIKIFECSLVTFISRSDYQINFNLHSLTLNLNNFSDIFTIISLTPNLEYLNVQCPPPRSVKSFDEPNINLKQLYLTMILNDEYRRSLSYIPMTYYNEINDLIYYIKLFPISLICLSLNLANFIADTINDFPFNNIELQELLESMVELKQFHVYARLPLYREDNEDILSKFKSKYWFDHNWIFGMHKNCFYTLPFHFDYLHEYHGTFNDIKSSMNEILINNPRIWFNVKTIELDDIETFDKNFLNQLNIKMPKLKFIKFINSYTDSNSDFNNDQTKEILNNVTTIQFDEVSMEERQEWFINELPNLKHLILSSVILPSTDNQLAEILNERIQRLDIDENSPIDQLIDTSYIYFSNVQYINWRLYDGCRGYEYYADCVMEILKRFPKLKIFVVYSRLICMYDRRYDRYDRDDLVDHLDVDYIHKYYEYDHDECYCLFRKKIL